MENHLMVCISNMWLKGKSGTEVNIVKTKIEGVIVLIPQLFTDDRGWFVESYNKNDLLKFGINIDFIQDNHSFSKQAGVIRGLHFQNSPYAQTKLVRCTQGKILDVAIDLRNGSPSYGQWVSVELSRDNGKQLLVPKGCAHGFLVLSEGAEVQYKVDTLYNKEADRVIRYDDPQIGIIWPKLEYILSSKDSNAPYLKDCDVNFTFVEERYK